MLNPVPAPLGGPLPSYLRLLPYTVRVVFVFRRPDLIETPLAQFGLNSDLVLNLLGFAPCEIQRTRGHLRMAVEAMDIMVKVSVLPGKFSCDGACLLSI